MISASSLDKDARLRVAEIFRNNGVETDIYVPKEADPTEAVFVVGSIAALPEATLTRALMDELGRKVWVTTNGEHWEDQIEPLLP
jgi:hypothetical protein